MSLSDQFTSVFGASLFSLIHNFHMFVNTSTHLLSCSLLCPTCWPIRLLINTSLFHRVTILWLVCSSPSQAESWTSMGLKELRDLVTTNDWTQVQSCWWSFGCTPVQWFQILTGQSHSCEKWFPHSTCRDPAWGRPFTCVLRVSSGDCDVGPGWRTLGLPLYGFLCSKEHKEHVGFFVFSWFKFLPLKYFYLVKIF